MWLALSLKKEATISAFGHEKKMKLSDLADGCVGCLLVFETKARAAEYVGDGGNVVEVQLA